MGRHALRLRGVAPAVIVGALALGCAGADGGQSTPSSAATATAAAGPDARATPPAGARAGGVRLVRVRDGLGDALLVTHAPGEPRTRLYVVQQGGRVLVLDRGRVRATPFLDISRRVSSGGERGLLGLAFHPRYARNGRVFVNYTDRAGDTRVVEYRRARPGRARPRGRVLLTIRQPFANHNGGHLAFGPDGHLYIATGDGGGAGDPGRVAQRRDSLLGKILRIDVDRRAGGRGYAIPRDNPFRGAGARPEVYAYGLRNPWRFSFDRARGDLWIADVGQDEREEVNWRPRGAARGANFGWSAFEGSARYPGGGPVMGRAPVRPVAQYLHSRTGGCSVTGGHVYRGRAVPALRGRYVYADFCSGDVWAMRAGPRPGAPRRITGALGARPSAVTSFGEDRAGELYLIGSGTLYRFAAR